MNQKEVLERINQILVSYDDQILIYNELPLELLKIIKESGNENQVLFILIKRLNLLAIYKNAAQLHHGEYKRINSDIYSLHIQTKNANIRILYGFIDDNPVLLHAFYERAGKGATNYTGEITIASQRLSERKKENVE